MENPGSFASLTLKGHTPRKGGQDIHIPVAHVKAKISMVSIKFFDNGS
jgi:hypothetical protein